jgi:hypothetical protein
MNMATRDWRDTRALVLLTCRIFCLRWAAANPDDALI